MKIKLLSVLLFSCLSFSSFADSLADRMTARRPAIEKLKQQGLVGENNQGYLEFIKKGGSDKNVTAQNSDRKEGYSQVAKKQGVKVEQVAKVRAAYYAKKAKSGEWVQSRSGKWKKK